MMVACVKAYELTNTRSARRKVGAPYKQAACQLNLSRNILGSVDSSTAEPIYRTMVMPIYGY